MKANVGMYQSFSAYLFSYEHAVKRLFAAIENGEEPVDLAAGPLLFLMRHTLELGYKFTLWELHEISGEGYDSKSYQTHSLSKLHAALPIQYQKVVKKLSLPDDEVKAFESYYAKTGAGMKEFEELDASSFCFRYPIDTKGLANFPHDKTVDLSAIKAVFDDSMVLLSCTADVLSEYVEINGWLESEARGFC